MLSSSSRVFYDLETTDQYAPYCSITIIGLLWDEGDKIETFRWPIGKKDFEYLRDIFANPEIQKIGFNNCNFDDLVLYRHGLPIEETNRDDAFLAIKTLHPELPSHSLKFLNWLFFGDFHWPEYRLECSQLSKGGKGKFISNNPDLLTAYNNHDLFQHRRIWDEKCVWGLTGNALKAYKLDISQGKPIEQMTFKGGLTIDKKKCIRMVAVLEKARIVNLQKANKDSGGRIENAGSSSQVGKYLDEEGYQLSLTGDGDFQVDKKVVEDLWRLSPVVRCVKNIRKIDSILKYYKNYLRAIECGGRKDNWIPVSYSISGARTRRYTSSSKYGLNFQNPNDAAKLVQIMPEGWLGWWIDGTQIENIVHIYESEDTARRKAYEANPDWSEYVWLCNEILRTNLTKKELDNIRSKQNENWSVYKQYKTVKLMMNFGAGAKKFSEVTGLNLSDSKKLIGDIHRACPAIHSLQRKVEKQLQLFGEIHDVFGHVYRWPSELAYKAVAYLIQGCGTGSLPKAQIRANYDLLQEYNNLYTTDVALLCTITHDEISGRIDLSIGEKVIEEILSRLMLNMTKKFEHLFDNIPLRAKLYLSTTSNKGRTECKSYANFRKITKSK